MSDVDSIKRNSLNIKLTFIFVCPFLHIQIVSKDPSIPARLPTEIEYKINDLSSLNNGSIKENKFDVKPADPMIPAEYKIH
jgi:hypothetical protein